MRLKRLDCYDWVGALGSLGAFGALGALGAFGPPPPCLHGVGVLECLLAAWYGSAHNKAIAFNEKLARRATVLRIWQH